MEKRGRVVESIQFLIRHKNKDCFTSNDEKDEKRDQFEITKKLENGFGCSNTQIAHFFKYEY